MSYAELRASLTSFLNSSEVLVGEGKRDKASALFRQAILENLTLDWQCEQPATCTEGDNAHVSEESENPEVSYIFSLISSIQDKLDILQQTVGREDLNEYAESHLKILITDLMEIETKVESHVDNLNVINDTLNNMARDTQGQVQMINGLISL